MRNSSALPLQLARGAARVIVAVLLCAWNAAAQPVELRIPNETVAPGGVLQAKLEVTEPRPIQTGGGGMSFGSYDEFLGLAVHSATGDAAAVGVMRGSSLRLRMVSPTSAIGALPDYPMLTTTLRVGPAAPATSVLDMTGATLTGPGGTQLPAIVRPGLATLAPGASIIDVTPGSAVVPAGAPIVITGLGFEPGMQVRFKDTAVTVEQVSSQAAIVRPARSVTMHGQEIQIEIPSTRQRLSYYSYQRTTTLGRSAHPLLGAVEPAFPRQSWSAALVRFGAPAAAIVYGVALQNEEFTARQVTLSLATAGGVVGPVSFTLPPNARVARSLQEVFGSPCAAGCTLRMSSSAPIQIFGLAGDMSADAVDPVLPSPDVSAVLGLTTVANAATYRVGDLVALTANFTPGVAPVVADVYLVLQTPSGDFVSLTPQGLQSGIHPRLSQFAITNPSSVEMLRGLVPPGTPPGRYFWLSALALPGTPQLLTPIGVTTFDIVP